MMQTKQKGKPRGRRRVVVPNGVILLAIIIVTIWVFDTVWRNFLYEPPPAEVWLEVKGTFADHPLETDDAPQDVISLHKPEETEEAATEPEDPFAETQQALFTPVIVHVPSNCVLMPQDATALASGKLLRLDSEHTYTGYEGELKPLSDSEGGYNVHSPSAEVMPCTLDAMDQMAQGYIAATGEHNLLAYSTTKAPEGGIYGEALPDMKTGYCIDLAYYDEEGRILPMYSRDVWLENNAYRYGFVFSYTEEDEDVTGIPSAPQHLRYVGKVHAGLMHELELTLAAYQKLLKSHPTSDPLLYETDSATYSVYYVPRSLGSTDVPVPKNGNYEISGDNESGFIIAAEGKIK